MAPELHVRFTSRRKLDFEDEISAERVHLKCSPPTSEILTHSTGISCDRHPTKHLKTESISLSQKAKSSSYNKTEAQRRHIKPKSPQKKPQKKYIKPEYTDTPTSTLAVKPHVEQNPVLDVSPLAYLSPTSVTESIKALPPYSGPFPSFISPKPESCLEVWRRLSQLHGPLEEYAKHRAAREPQVPALEYNQNKDEICATPVQDSKLADSSQAIVSNSNCSRTVLDSVVATILSQNTIERNSRRAFSQLKSRFPTWEKVYNAAVNDVEDAIRCAGLAERKASRILNILSILHKEKGKLCLEYVRSMSVEEIKLELSRFKGVGPKTIACVLMFHLQKNEFPVDTHVFRITKLLGWIPTNADREKAYLHLNQRIPDELKFDLHCLLVTHGRRCSECSSNGRAQQPVDGPCPLVNMHVRSLKSG